MSDLGPWKGKGGTRKALKTRNWEVAGRIVREWEDEGKEKALAILTSEPCDRFYADCVARRLSESSHGKYRLLMDELKGEFQGIHREFSTGEVRRFRETWKFAAITTAKKLERLRTFFKFRVDRSKSGGSRPF